MGRSFHRAAGHGNGVAYDDNFDVDNDHRVGNFIWFGAAGLAGTGLYLQNSSENEVMSWAVGANGRLDLTRRSQLVGRVDYTRAEESR